MKFYYTADINDYGEVVDVDNRDRNNIKIELLFHGKESKKFNLLKAFGKSVFNNEKLEIEDIDSLISKLDELVDSGKLNERINDRILKENENILRNKNNNLFEYLKKEFGFDGFLYEINFDDIVKLFSNGEIAVKDYLDLKFQHIISSTQNALLCLSIGFEQIKSLELFDGKPLDSNTKSMKFSEYLINDYMDWNTIFYRGIMPTDSQCKKNKDLLIARDTVRRIQGACIRVFDNIPVSCIKKIIVYDEKKSVTLKKLLSDYSTKIRIEVNADNES